MRRIFCLLFASALAGGGVYLLYFQFFRSASIWAFGRVLPIGICFAGIGVFWLWTDFIAPMLGRGVR